MSTKITPVSIATTLTTATTIADSSVRLHSYIGQLVKGSVSVQGETTR